MLCQVYKLITGPNGSRLSNCYIINKSEKVDNMNKLLTVVGFTIFSVSIANAEGWYEVDTSIFKRVEVRTDNRISIQKIWQDTSHVNIQRVGSTPGTWLTNNIESTPPPGQEKSYLSLVLTAVTAGKSLYVYTSSSAGTGDVPVTRMQIQ